jgi:hypothetical protein
MLNLAEASDWTECHFMGAWCVDKVLGTTFVTFLPAAVYRRGLLDALVLSMAVRAKWTKRYLG